MLTLFISFTHSSDVTWLHPQTPQTPRFPALANPVPFCCGDHLGCWAVAKEPRGALHWARPQSPDRTSRGQQAGVSPEQPLPRPLVPITILSPALPDPPLPNPFQHHFWFFSGDALCPPRPTSLHTSRHPAWPPAGGWSGYAGWECDEWPGAEGSECAKGPQGARTLAQLVTP